MQIEPYAHAVTQWPPVGRHILAQHDAETLIVYQAFNPAIASAAVADQRLGGGGFSLTRMSWDPDHAPDGRASPRRAIQLGLRGEVLGRFAQEWPLAIEDITPFVVAQRGRVGTPDLQVPVERAVALAPDVAARIGADVH
ncbi:MAG: DUF4291 family protein [Myxococcota bacterium]